MATGIRFDGTTAIRSIKNLELFLNNQFYKKELQDIIVRDFMKNFQAQGRPTRWQALEESTLKRRRKGKNKGSTKILIDSGVMVTTIHAVNSGRGFYVTTDASYAADHDMGTERIPQRKFFIISEEAGREIDSLGKKFEKSAIR